MLNIWRISWRNTVQNRKRFFFTLLALVTGMSFVTSMLIADRTTNDVFDYYEKMYVANADYWVLSDQHTYPEKMISTIQKDPDVTNTLLTLDKQAFFELKGDHSLNERSVRITGVSDQKSTLLPLPVIKGDLDNKGIVMPENVAKLLKKDVGDTVHFSGMGKAKISAIVEYTQLLSSPSNWEDAKSSSFRVMVPLDMLRKWTGKNDEISYMRFQTKGSGENLFHSLQNKYRESNLYIEPVVADDLQSNDISGLYTFFYIIAGLAIFVSGFIVFNMIYTSVIERKKEFAIMKSLGYTNSSVSRLVLTEIILLAIIGSAIGIPLGIWLGDLFMQALLSVFKFDMVYTLNWKLPTLIAIVIGLIFPIIFSLFPIYNAGKTSILMTLKNSKDKNMLLPHHFIRTVIGIGFLSLAFIDHPVSYGAVIAGTILVFPILLIGLTKIAKLPLKALFKFAGVMASKNLMQQINRNSNTAAILAIGISVILLLGSVVQSAPVGLEKEIKETYGGDMRVTSEVPWAADDIDKIKSYQFVKDVTPLFEASPITWENTNSEKRQFSVIGTTQEGFSLFSDLQKDNLHKQLKQGPSILLGERAFKEWGGNTGQDILINTPNGKKYFEVVGSVKTSHYSGYVAFMDENRLKNDFGWASSFDILLTTDKKTSNSVRNQLWSDSRDHLSKIQTVEEEISSTISAISGMNSLISIMLFMIIGLASIGTANTLIMNIHERRLEIATMRAIGFTKKQVRNMILVEGSLIGLSGVVVGIATGILLIYLASKSKLMEGFITFQLPVINIVYTMLAGILLSLCAAWISSKAASKEDIQLSLKEG